MMVGRCMTKNPVTVTPDVSVPEAQAIMRREKIKRLPVLDKNNRLVGIVTATDLIHALPSPASALDIYELHYLISKLKVEAVMTKKVLTTIEDCAIEDAARVMNENDISGLPVMRGDLLVGIITESDLFELFIELFAARRRGLRVTMMIPEQKGELAAIASTIAREGGNILSFASFDGDDPSNSCCTMKVDGLDKQQLMDILLPLVEKVVDIR